MCYCHEMSANEHVLDLPLQEGMRELLNMKKTSLWVVFLIILSSANPVVNEDETTVSVSRRQGGDIKFYNESLHETCSGDNLTFLVSEKICVKDQGLISGIH